MSDIVERLRALQHFDGCYPIPHPTCETGARTIESLRTQLATVLDRETATTARYDARIYELEAENARLREALQPFSDFIAPTMNDQFPNNMSIGVTMPHEGRVLTFGDFRRAREALKETK